MGKTAINCRNPVRNSTGGIDCEMEHPELGWVPFTARSDDPEKHGRDIYAYLDRSIAPDGSASNN